MSDISTFSDLILTKINPSIQLTIQEASHHHQRSDLPKKISKSLKMKSLLSQIEAHCDSDNEEPILDLETNTLQLATNPISMELQASSSLDSKKKEYKELKRLQIESDMVDGRFAVFRALWTRQEYAAPKAMTH